MEARFARAVRGQRLVKPDEKLVVGVSGGADSVALLHLFRAMDQQLHVAHLNHGLRGTESDADAEFVAQLAASLGLPCTIGTADVAEHARAAHISIEEAGRHCRLAFFERVALQAGATAVALAHHADDNAETVLHRIIRGTSLRGVAGIPRQRRIRRGSKIRLIRPLLGFRREEIETYLNTRGIAFREDASNLSSDFTRNRIRNELLPLIRERFSPQVGEALVRLAEQARDVDAYLTGVAREVLGMLLIQQDEHQIVLDASLLAAEPPVLQTHVIRQAMIRLGARQGRLTRAHLNAVVNLIHRRRGGKVLQLPGGLRVRWHRRQVVIEHNAARSAVPLAGRAPKASVPGNPGG